jgi:hypothetical protein
MSDSPWCQPAERRLARIEPRQFTEVVGVHHQQFEVARVIRRRHFESKQRRSWNFLRQAADFATQTEQTTGIGPTDEHDPLVGVGELEDTELTRQRSQRGRIDRTPWLGATDLHRCSVYGYGNIPQRPSGARL